MEIIEAQALVEREQPALVVVNNPFVASEGRQTFRDAFLPGETLGRYCERVGVVLPSRVTNVWHNGRAVPGELWRRLIPRNGDQVVIRAKGEGGGGGGKVLRTVAMIALVVVSMGYGAALGGALGFTGSMAGAVGSSLIMIGGSLLVNALLPMPTPTAAKLGTGQKYESSPTYAIQGGRNQTRAWEPMALVFGRHKVVPDNGAKPYSQYVGDTQFLNQIFHFGLQLNGITLSDLKIGETPVSNYQGSSCNRPTPTPARCPCSPATWIRCRGSRCNPV